MSYAIGENLNLKSFIRLRVEGERSVLDNVMNLGLISSYECPKSEKQMLLMGPKDVNEIFHGCFL